MEAHNELKFFYGSSNPLLGEAIVKELGVENGKILLKKFSDGETYAQFGENVRAKDVFLLQTACEPMNDNLVELLLMIDAAKRSSAGRITAIIPNYFYARQDRKADSREPITAKLIADLLTTAGANRVLTLDLHSEQIQGFFNIPLDNLPARTMMIKKAKELSANYIIVSPDAGAAKVSTKLALKMCTGLAIINKMRTEHNQCQAMNIIGDSVKGKDCFIFDDIIDTGGSLCNAAQVLKKEGAEKIYAFVTHGVLSGNAIEKIENSVIEKLYITDSVPSKKSKKIEIISVAKYLADAIKCINEDKSVSLLFEEA
ncbi:MAG: ribose-phosphate pyrophosphokinase [archaeon]|jgi:ribose-phosphate pyrophosphokinase